jgi:2,4-dienoyl-CoA reductase-like NADH-dependent reductase (Old Yellow Enzyme family)
MTQSEIRDTVERFAKTAKLAKDCGWGGVQIHAAHGYLISEFLSPRTNRRSDAWGGSLQNRSRFLREVVQRTREEVGPDFPISVKLNSADFQRNGFSEADASEVVKMLETLGIDLLEISGGTYEFAAAMGVSQPQTSRTESIKAQSKSLAASTIAREAYFIEFAESIRQTTEIPLMLTGGFRSADAMCEAISLGIVDFVGVARPMCLDPRFPAKILSGELKRLDLVNISVGIKDFDSGLQNLWHQRQIHRMAEGLAPDPNMGRIYCLTVMIVLNYVWHPRTAGIYSVCTLAALFVFILSFLW